MRFFNTTGVLGTGRRSVSGSASVQEEEVKNTSKLAEVLRGLLRRLSEVEAKVGKEPTEYEVEVTAGDTVTLTHGYNSPVRYWTVFWTRKRAIGSADPTTTSTFVALGTSDPNRLVLKAVGTGRAIIRVEPSQYGLSANG